MDPVEELVEIALERSPVEAGRERLRALCIALGRDPSGTTALIERLRRMTLGTPAVALLLQTIRIERCLLASEARSCGSVMAFASAVAVAGFTSAVFGAVNAVELLAGIGVVVSGAGSAGWWRALAARRRAEQGVAALAALAERLDGALDGMDRSHDRP